MHQIYRDGSYLQNNPSWHDEDAPWKAEQITRIIRKNQIACRSICDVGCGTGGVLVALKQSFSDAELVGYEMSPDALAVALRRDSDISFSELDIRREQKTFDMILVVDVIEHVEDYIGFVKSIAGKSIYCIFHIPLDISVQSVWRSAPILRSRARVGHLHYFSKETALATLRDCGYKIVDYRYTASRLELPNQALSSRLMKVPRRVLFSIWPNLTVRILGGFSLLVLAKNERIHSDP